MKLLIISSNDSENRPERKLFYKSQQKILISVFRQETADINVPNGTFYFSDVLKLV
jgi:hypothetical protein